MSPFSSFVIDWPELRTYMIGPIGLTIALFFNSGSRLKRRAIFRQICAGLAGFWILMCGWVMELSANHVSRFEEIMLSALALTFVLIIDHKASR